MWGKSKQKALISGTALALFLSVFTATPAGALDCTPRESANLSNCDLSNSSLTNKILRGINFSNAKLTNVDFSGSSLINVNLDGADLAGSILENVKSSGVLGTPHALPDHWKIGKGFLIGPTANLQSADLTNYSFSGFSFLRTNLRSAKIGGSNFSDASLEGVSSGSVAGVGSVTLPVGWVLANGYLVGRGANLQNAFLGSADLTDVNLYGANIQDADLRAVKLRRVQSGGLVGTPKATNGSALPSGYKLQAGYLLGPEVNLDNADLTNLDLGSAALSFASMRGTDLTGANLEKANLNRVISERIIGNPALPAGTKVVNGYLLGPNVRAYGADLIGADLSMLDLSGADLKGANLTNVKMHGTQIGSAEFENATFDQLQTKDLNGSPHSIPAGWKLVSKSLVGPKADLGGLDLHSTNLSGMNLEYASFAGANLDGADFSGSNLSFCNLEGASLIGAYFRDANLSNARASGASFSNGELPTGWALDTGVVLRAMSLKPNPTLTGTNKVGQTLTASPGTWDSGVTLTYQWLRDGVAIAGADKNTLQLTTVDNGQQITVEITATKAGYATVKKTSAAVTVEAGTQALTPTPTVTGTNKVGQTLTASPGTWDSGVTLTYQWLRDGVAIAGADKNTLQLTTVDNGKQITVEVTGTKTGYATVMKTSTAIKIEAGTLTLTPTPTVTGTHKVGQTLTATAGNWDSGVTLNYQWVRDGVKINGAASASYVVTPGDFGKNVGVEVTGALAGYAAVPRLSAPVNVAAGLMTITTPKVTGTAKSGGIVKVTSAAWVKGAKITYQWLSNGAVIKGATSSSLKIAATLKGKKISVKVTQSALGYTTATKTSATVTVSK